MLGLKKAVIVTLQNDFGKSLAAGFKEVSANYGIDIVGEYEYSIKDRQFGPIVSKIRADNPDVIYATGYFFTAGPLVSQLRAAGITTTVIGQEGYDSQKFIDIAGPAAEGTIITTSLDRDSTAVETQDFITAFEAKTGNKADMVAASAHTAIKVLAAALQSSDNGDKAALRDAIMSTQLTASTGEISFNGLGEVQKSVQVQIVKDGQWRHHSVIDDADLLAPPTE
jgi:branched-chain amino acid transport system substrate-binding protein